MCGVLKVLSQCVLSVWTCKFWVKLEERIGKSCTFARFFKTKAASAVILSE